MRNGAAFVMREGLGFEMTHSADTILGCVETASFCGRGLKFLLDCIRHLLDARLPPFLQGVVQDGIPQCQAKDDEFPLLQCRILLVKIQQRRFGKAIDTIAKVCYRKEIVAAVLVGSPACQSSCRG